MFVLVYISLNDDINNINWNTLSGKPSTYTPSSHTHDDRYYTEGEVNNLLSSYVNNSVVSGGSIQNMNTGLFSSVAANWYRIGKIVILYYSVERIIGGSCSSFAIAGIPAPSSSKGFVITFSNVTGSNISTTQLAYGYLESTNISYYAANNSNSSYYCGNCVYTVA